MDLLNLLSANEIFAQTLAFLLLAWILKKVFWKKVLAALDDRKARVASEIKEAETHRAEAQRIKLNYENAMADIDRSAREKMQAAIEEGRRIAGEIREDAVKNVEEMVDNARITIATETAKAKDELKRSVVDLVIDTAGKVIQEKLSVEEDRKLVEYFLKQSEAQK